jgi:hypothetical protein
MRVYVASLGLWLTLDSGKFEEVAVNTSTGLVRISLSPADAHTAHARLRIEQPAKVTGAGTYRPSEELAQERGAYVVPLKKSATQVELK